MGIWESVKGFFYKADANKYDKNNNAIVGTVPPKDSLGILKAYIPYFLYKPPYGYPRKANLPLIRTLATTPYVFSVMKTLSDEASSLKYDIVVRENVDHPEKYDEKIKEIKGFFRNPNSNEESWEHVQRCLIRDIVEVDSGVIVKVFNKKEEFVEMYARDGVTFLKNPNIYGSLGPRSDFVLPIGTMYGVQSINDEMQKNYYDTYAIQKAAYFQYGWTAGSYPTPFGKREIVYIMQNPRSDSVYGRSPVEILADIVMTLHYGSQYNLDFYLNSNIPEGIVQMEGVQKDELDATNKKFHDKITVKDGLDNERRIGHKIPFTSAKNVKFVAFTIPPKEMQIIEQQEWFIKVLWMCFGVTPDEMGITDQSNRAISSEQTKVFKRKAIRPICNVIKYHVDTQVLPEFFMDEFKDWEEAVNNCPVEFKYLDYDLEEDMKKHNILESEIRMGVKTAEMAAEELGINVEELKKSKEENRDNQMDLFQKKKKLFGDKEEGQNEEEPGQEDNNKLINTDKKIESEEEKKKKPEEKALSPEQELEKEIKDHIKQIDKSLEAAALEE